MPYPTDEHTYIGRFAPSPTGPLHLGSLFTALAGFLDARARQGKWLLRIDDLDQPRIVSGATESILKTLETFGLTWDDSISYQSRHLDGYHHHLETLIKNRYCYPCICSRKTLADAITPDSTADVYPGFCKGRAIPPDTPSALRIIANDRIIAFDDRLQGRIASPLAEQHGDFVIQRKDGIMAYQFAVVIDDALHQVNQIVRGMDLLESTPKQIFLQQILGLATPEYMHVPVMVDRQGYKLSKQTLATAVDHSHPPAVLFDLLLLLKQNPPSELARTNLSEILAWAIANWNPEPLKNIKVVEQKIN